MFCRHCSVVMFIDHQVLIWQQPAPHGEHRSITKSTHTMCLLLHPTPLLTLSCYVSVSLSDFNETSIFWTGFSNSFRHPVSRKSVQLELTCLIRTDGRTDRKCHWRCKIMLYSAIFFYSCCLRKCGNVMYWTSVNFLSVTVAAVCLCSHLLLRQLF